MSEENFDDEERFNLALHSEFDSALLNCLGDEDDPSNNNGNDDLGEASDFSVSSTQGNSPMLTAGSLGGGGGRSMPRLPSFVLEGGSSEAGDDPLGVGPSSVLGETPTPLGAGTPQTPTQACPTSPFSSVGANATKKTQQQMHPLAINSSASCPPTQHAGSSNNNSNGNNTNPFLSGLMDPQMTTAALQAAFASSLMQFSSNTSFNPTTGFNPALQFGSSAGMNATPAYNPALQFNNNNNNNAAFNPALVPLAYNALAAGVDLSNFLPQLSGAPPLPAQAHAKAPPLAAAGKPASKNKSNGNKRRKGTGNGKSKKKSKTNPSSQKQQPPFLLFDAPCELRHNFIQSQRSHGIPDLDDTNSYHYGVSVNGFHPQRSLDEPYLYKSLSANRALPDPVPVVDARHSDVGSKRVKNAKEQKRAHRISELIDQLRVKMEKGGWNVGIKSKFHTLSSCSDYVRHLMTINKEKEAAVEQAKKDLAAKREKMEEEKKTQQDPSDPESTTSSLTVSSQSDRNDKKRKGQPKEDCDRKARHLESRESTMTSSSGSSDDAKNDPNTFCIGAASMVSEITDSNKGDSSSSGGDSSSNDSPRKEAKPDKTVSEEVADVSGPDSSTSRNIMKLQDRAVSVSTSSARTAAEVSTDSEKTSLDSDFELDYEEVFVKSNVPQILASTNGRILAYNDFFLKVSGMTPKEVEKLTIFSLVQTSLLSNLFELVAAALRSNELTDSNSPDGDSPDAEKLAPLQDYETMTLPCVDFAKLFQDEGRIGDPPPSRQLHMTLTVMTDADVRKRCFHCIFTDCQGTNGALGSVTPELLEALFSTSSDAPEPDAITEAPPAETSSAEKEPTDDNETN